MATYTAKNGITVEYCTCGCHKHGIYMDHCIPCCDVTYNKYLDDNGQVIQQDLETVCEKHANDKLAYMKTLPSWAANIK